MLRPTITWLASRHNPAPARTIVRDPRKKSFPSVPNISNSLIETKGPLQSLTPSNDKPIGAAFDRDHQSTGAVLASYALAGVGVALGVGLVRLVFGV